jgi:hypothetical protein
MKVRIFTLGNQLNGKVESEATPAADDRSEKRLLAAQAASSRGRSRLHHDPGACLIALTGSFKRSLFRSFYEVQRLRTRR